jgi:hypothetical protein
MSRETRELVIAILILLSLAGVHYTFFVYALPSGLRALIDLEFKSDFFADFFIAASISLIIGRYLPEMLLAFSAYFYEASVECSYLKRGYQRLAKPLGLLKKENLLDRQKRSHYLKRLRRFGRNEARFSNFITHKIHSLMPIRFYERHKASVTVFFALLVFGYLYIGPVAGFLISISGIVFAALSSYYGFKDPYIFRLKGLRFRGDDPNHDSAEAEGFDTRDLMLFALALVVVCAIAAPLHLEKLKDGDRVTVNWAGNEISGSIIGSTSNGIIVFSQDFLFISHPLSATPTENISLGISD